MDFGLEALLRLAWAAGSLPILAAFLPIPGAVLLHRIILGFAARGKIMHSSSRKFTVPQKYFLHFYVVAVALTTCFLLSTWFCAYRKTLSCDAASLRYSTVAGNMTGDSHMFYFRKSLSSPVEHKYQVERTTFVLLLMEAQVLRRLHETRNVFNYSPSARMHILGYLTGLFFYTAAPLSLGNTCALEALIYVGDQITEFVVRGRALMLDLEFDWWEFLKPLISLGWCQWIGAAIFIWGWFHQLRCHAILGSLRKERGAYDYVIPRGDWFEYVSCPHYLAEIVIYAGILVASGGLDLTVCLLFMFVVSNLVLVAAETHKWYHQKFEDYPTSRRAIIPFIY